jgi:hypothetical protein
VSRPANSFPSQTPTSLGTDTTSFTIDIQLLAEPDGTRLASAKADPKWAALLPRSTTTMSISCFWAQTVHANFQEGFTLGNFCVERRDDFLHELASCLQQADLLPQARDFITLLLECRLEQEGFLVFRRAPNPYYSSSIVQVHHPRPFLP